jgi:hypothetical protein
MLTRMVFEELLQLAETGRGALVVVYLPEREECLGGWLTGYRMGLLAKKSARDLGVPVIDLTPECQALAADEVDALFIRKGEVDDPNAPGHYSALGNRFAAEVILRGLAGIPAVSASLERLGPAAAR